MSSGSRNRRLSRQKLARIRLLSLELDNYRTAAVDRSRSIETKASFLVVAAGLLFTVTGVDLITSRAFSAGLVPLALLVGTVVVSAIALWPRGLSVPSARQVVDEWRGGNMRAAELEDNILEVKAKETTEREAQNERRAKWVKIGFSLLVASLVTAFVVITVNTATAPEENSDGKAHYADTETGSRSESPER